MALANPTVMALSSALANQAAANEIRDILEFVTAPGKRFFVSSTNGVDSGNRGRSPDAPLATLDYAIGLCTAGKGDRIYLLPGHAETITTASALTADVAGIQIIGLGVGEAIATFTLGTATTATFNVTAASVLIRNIKIASNLADVAAGITASAAADGLVVENCHFTDGASNKELVIAISIAAACDNVLIQNCRFYGTAAADNDSAIKFAGATTRSRVIGNLIYGDFDTAGIAGATAAGSGVLIQENRVTNLDSGAGLALSLHASTTGLVSDNRFFGGKTNTVPVAAAGCHHAENYTACAVNESGIIRPNVETYT
jgi:hypothetical protein